MNKQYSPNSSCLSCGGSLSISEERIFDTRFGIDALYSIGLCPACGLECTAPVPDEKELNHLYEKYYNFGGESNTAYTRLREKFLFSVFYRFWLFLDGDITFYSMKGRGRLLDVGCNEGRGLQFYKKNGFTVEGLEPNEKAAEVARSLGFIVYSKPLEELQKNDAYDIVVLSNVLEHSLKTKDMLYHLKRILKPGGGILISCPNSKSWMRSLFGKYWINWHVPFHIVHFSAKTLTKTLKDAGFKDIIIKNATPALWIAHSLLARLFAKQGKVTRQLRSPFIVAPLILLIRIFFFPLLCLGNKIGRGDCLIVSAKK